MFAHLSQRRMYYSRVQLRFCKCSRTLIKVYYCFYPYYSIAHGTFAPPFKTLLRKNI